MTLTFYELVQATRALHQDDPAYVARLHDVWKRGAPTPDSILRDPRRYDERLIQPGNIEKRVILPSALAEWIMDASAARGFPYSREQALAMTQGRALR